MNKYLAILILISLGCGKTKTQTSPGPQRIYYPQASYRIGDFFITNELFYADGYMESELGGELWILDTIGYELDHHPELYLQVVTPDLPFNTPSYSSCTICNRHMAIVGWIGCNRYNDQRVRWDLDSLPGMIRGDGDYHTQKSTVFIVTSQKKEGKSGAD